MREALAKEPRPLFLRMNKEVLLNQPELDALIVRRWHRNQGTATPPLLA
jgi:hypothetical protein